MTLPATCERPILEQFLRAEAMALYAVRSAQAHVPPHALEFLRRHEEEELEHLREFEAMTGITARIRTHLPKLPGPWYACAVQLYGYEALGLEFARLLVGMRPDLAHILADEETHVAFFESEVQRIMASGRPANGARQYARGWIRRLPKTVGRYFQGDDLAPYRDELSRTVFKSIEDRFVSIGLLER